MGRGGIGADGGGGGARRVEYLTLEEELGYSFGRYAEKVILDRAIPDVRDGLKPVQRRIIYAMVRAGNTPDRPYRKSAATVGDTIGKYHPHGDSAIYDALVRLAQPWKMRYPLIDGHGNFGSMDDDPAAAMRYTEARLSPIAMELLADLDKDTVPWRPTYDEKDVEPVVLPAGFLNLLVNGTSGVSAGFATEVPSHNLGEIVDACLALMKDPDLTSAQLMRWVKGPDFPTGGIVMGAEGLVEAYETGRGKVVLRGRHTIEKQRDGKHLIVFTEIPYNVVKSDLIRQMDAIRVDKEVHGVLDVRDETDREGLRVVIEVSKTVEPEGVLAYFLKKTDLQINYNFNMTTIWRATPRQMGLRAIVRAFLDHRREVVLRRTRHDLAGAEARLHEVEGFLKAVDVLDEVIQTIRHSEDRADARANLVARFGFTEVQADAILDLRLVRLTNLQILQLQEEQAALLATVAELSAILADMAVCDRVVAGELEGVKKRHADARRTTIEAQVERLDVALEVTVKPQDVVVGITRDGWVKRASLPSFQATGGDRASSGVRPGDRMHYVLHSNTTHLILVFSASGQCFPIPVHQIPEARWGDVGTALVNVCGIDKDDGVTAVVVPGDYSGDRHLLFITAQGMTKATPLSEFQSTYSAGLIAIKLDEGDRLARVLEAGPVEGDDGDCLILTQSGQGIRFPVSEVSVQGRAAKGVRAMKVEDDDLVRDAIVVPPDPSLQIATFTLSGRSKLSPLEQYPRQRRGGKGVRMIISRTGTPHHCVALSGCGLRDTFLIVDSAGKEHVLPAKAIPVTRRDGNAWDLVKLPGDVHVALVEHVPAAPESLPAEGASEGSAT